MNAPPDSAVLDRLEAFALDDPAAVFPFTARLAAENGWTRDFARRVAAEYKRFVWLALAAGHPVSPSEAVDQAWHLHMIYTRSYWEEMCQGILGCPLHHSPTRGGREEGEKFADWRRRTLESYRLIFGEPPPPDIWPPPGAPSAPAGVPRWIDASRFWMIPRPRWLRSGGGGRQGKGFGFRSALRSAPVTTAVIVCLAFPVINFPGKDAASGAADGSTVKQAGITGSLWIFNWTAGPFLLFYFIALIVAVMLSLVLRNRAFRNPPPDSEPPEPELTDLYDQAMLSGGECRVAQTALVSLILAGSLGVTRTRLRRVMVEKTGPPPEHPVENAFYKAVSRSGRLPLKGLSRRIPEPGIRLRLTERLVRAGLLPEKRGRRVWSVAWPLMLLMALGLIRLFLGIHREKPVGFLVVLLIVTAITCFLVTRMRSLRPPLAERVLSRLRRNPPSARDQPAAAFALEGPEVLTSLAVPALLGATFLEAQRWQQQQVRQSGCGGGTGCSGVTGGCGGDSGGSSSGCGGGGCGGCGGGD